MRAAASLAAPVAFFAVFLAGASATALFLATASPAGALFLAPPP
ncbi:hypothetical protein ACFXAE_18805 [Streptomyces sp. NPDC059454]